MPGALKAKVNGQWVLASSAAGGGGAEEVYVGTTDPGSSYDIWVDTDEPAVLTNDMRWNTAWGVVASVEGSNDITVTDTVPYVLASISFTAVAGRKYEAHYHAVGSFEYQNATLHCSLRLDGSGTTPLAEHRENVVQGAQHTISMTGSFTPTAGSHPVYAYFHFPNVAAALTVKGSWSPWQLVVSDVGPASGAVAAPMSSTDRWNTAWGVVAVGSLALDPVPTGVSRMTSNLPFTTVVGRRYRMVLQIRIVWKTDAAGTGLNFLPVGPAVGGAGWDTWLDVQGDWAPLYTEVLFTGNGVSGNFYWNVYNTSPAAASVAIDTMSCFYIEEDVGPVSGAVAIADPTPAWIPFPFAIGWGNYLNTYTACGYRKLGDIVFLRGLAVCDPAFGGAPAAAIGSLPVGYRPPATAIFTTQCAGGALRSDVYANGAVTNGTMPLNTGNWLTLEGISFR